LTELLNVETAYPPFATLLPSLPSLVRYWDDFDECFRTLEEPSHDHWTIVFDTVAGRLNFAKVFTRDRPFLKLALATGLVGLSPRTVRKYGETILGLDPQLVDRVVASILGGGPHHFHEHWISDFRPALESNAQVAIRFLARVACQHAIGGWTTSHERLIRQLPGSPLRAYEGVIDGSSVISHAAQSRLIAIVDQAAADAVNGSAEITNLRSAAVLALSFQYGLRRGQTARVKREDVRLHRSGAIHVRVTLLKQRGAKRGRQVVRPIQESWRPIFRVLLGQNHLLPTDSFLDVTPDQVGRIVSGVGELIGLDRLNPGMLRHTAAQRLVDGGASHQAVSEFLGHTDLTAARVYFDASAKQGELVNAALGLSDIYRNVEKVARTKTIDPDLLRASPLDQQIAGAPHGVPLAGIGLCRVGQSLCQRNPVSACYTCHKFLPVSEASIHQGVLEQLRAVVSTFERPDRVDRVSPATLQLRHTVEAVQRLVHELVEGCDEA
jgi:integrase